LPVSWPAWQGLGSLLLWFTWPAWPLVVWTLWRWRRQLISQHLSRHLSLPLWFALVTVGATLITPAGDRALLLALPALATLAAFALPTLQRSVSSLIDWFTLIFFTSCAIIIWVVWIAMQTGFPPQPAANVARLAPGFEPRFIILPFLFALLATWAWGWLVKWRVGRHPAAIWKSLVLPAGGAALCWLLLTTLWMPLLDFARSYAPLVKRIAATVQPATCIETFGLRPGLLVGLRFHATLRLEPASDRARCMWLVVDKDIVTQTPEIVNPAQWTRHIEMGHPREGEEDIVIYRRKAAPGS
jgi:4-amino-4-deoxy-L-arabinose transferase-like glycosyltransferase